MKRIYQALLLGSALIATALLAVLDTVPEEAAQFAPFLLFALFPDAWLRGQRSCNLLKGANR